MSALTEKQARSAETDLMSGRLAALTRQHDLNADQRIGACLALKVLEARRRELRERANGATD